MKCTNAERIANHIKENGTGGLMIHTVPGTPFWLICQNDKERTWNITLCHPQQTKSYKIAENISDEEHFELWNQIITLELSRRIRTAIKKLRTHWEHYLQNRIKSPKRMTKIHSSGFKKDKAMRISLKVTRAAIQELRVK